MGDDCSPRGGRAGCNVDGFVTNCIVSEPSGQVRKEMSTRSDEPELRGLMLAGVFALNAKTGEIL
jgi:hypothetical protein